MDNARKRRHDMKICRRRRLDAAMKHAREFWVILLALCATITVAIAPASAQQQLEGQVLGAGAPIANATVTLWAASAGAPAQLSRTESGTDGRFTLRFARAPSGDSSLYLVATGGEPTANKGGGNNPA